MINSVKLMASAQALLAVSVIWACLPLSAAAATPVKIEGKRHGTTTISVPNVLFNIRLDNNGKLTGSGSTVYVDHKDPGAFCSKVNDVSVLLTGNCSGQACYHHASPPRRELNLCSFNGSDVKFDFILPGINTPSQLGAVTAKLSAGCKASGKNGTTLTTKHPFFNGYLNINVFYNNHENYMEQYLAPPIILTCDPCPPLAVKESIQLQPDSMITISDNMLVSGGIPPYSVRFNSVPTGLIQQGSSLTGRPAAGVYRSTITVEDSCKSASNRIEKSFEFRIKDSMAPVINRASVTPATLEAQGGIVLCQLTASDNRGVASANAYISGPGVTMTLPLSRAGDNVWQANYQAPTNKNAQDVTYRVDFQATDIDGNKSNSSGAIKTFIVMKDRAAPVISGVKATPSSLTSDGGPITVSAVIQDNLAVQNAIIHLTSPDGRHTAGKLSMASGTAVNGEWKITWSVPANRTVNPQQYSVQISAADSLGNTATSQQISFSIQPSSSTNTYNYKAPGKIPSRPILNR